MIDELRQRFALFKPTRTPDGAGGFTETMVANGKLWGAFALEPTREAIANDGTSNTTQGRFLVRASGTGNATVLPGDQLVWRAHRYRVIGAQISPTNPAIQMLDVEEEVRR